VATGILHPGRAGRPSKSLVVRGGVARTFGSLACFLAITFLGGGAYIIADTFANPVAAEAAALIAAAFIIALASIILFYLLKPRRKLSAVRVRYKVGAGAKLRQGISARAQSGEHDCAEQMELPYHRSYVDRARIRA
jgi:hypothetical protein